MTKATDASHQEIQRPTQTMQNVTSTWTLFLKWFLPTIYIVFFGTLLLIFLLAKDFSIGPFSPLQFKLFFVAMIVVGVGLLYMSVMRLKRVEMDAHFVYVTNYLKIYKYPYTNIAALEERNYGLFRTVSVHFITPGYFGKKATFIPNKARFAHFLANCPAAAAKLTAK